MTREKTYFSDQQTAWRFAKMIAGVSHYIVSDYGRDDGRIKEPYFVETMHDHWMSKDQLRKIAGKVVNV